MNHRTVLMKHFREEGGWRLQWTDTSEPADKRLFPSLESASRVARALMGVPEPKPDLRIVKGRRRG